MPPCCGARRVQGLPCLSPAAPGPRPGPPAPRAPSAAPCWAPKPHLDSPQPSSCFRPTRPSAERGWTRCAGGGLGAPLLSPASRGPVGSLCGTACSRVMWSVRSHRHSTASPVPSPPGSQPGFRHAAGECTVGASHPRSCRQAAEMHSLTCTDSLAALSPVRVQAVRCSQSRSDVSTQRLAQIPQQGTAARASTQEKAAALWAFAVRPPGAAPPMVQQAGGAGRGQPSDTPGCQLWLSPLACAHAVHRATHRAKGTKLLCVTPGDGGSTAREALGCWPPVRGPGDQELGVSGAVERDAWLPKPRKSWKTRLTLTREPAALCHQLCVLRTLWSLKEPRLHPSSSGTNGNLTSFHEHPRQLSGNT